MDCTIKIMMALSPSPPALGATMSQFQWHFPLGHLYLAKLKSTIPTSSHLSLAQQ